jgi:tetratricopeptide (TPR) repeat protein
MHAEARDWSTLTQIGTQINQAPPLPAEAFRPWAELAAPPGLGNLPTRPGPFVGRTGELARLDAALAGPGGAVVQAVHGLGGIGKSTLAAHWAAAHASDHTLTWWITAATPADIDAGLASLAAALQPALTGLLPLEALREGAVQWLAAHRGWLLILDNVTDPADVAPLLARAPSGRYLITSRRATGWHATAVPVRLDVLDPAKAELLLTEILTRDRPRAVDGAGELCAELGFLPLAIEQAGAYLAQAGATPRQYLDLLARYPAAMYQAAAEGGDAARTIARIWHVTLDRLAADPLAGQVLRILAWYAPEAIPRILLDGLADPPALLHALGRLAAYSMLTADTSVLAVHRLVQAVTRTADAGDPHRDPQAIDDARDRAALQLLAAAPRNPRDPAGWSAWRMLLPHVDALVSYTSPGADTEATAFLLNEAGVFLESQGQPARAAGHLQRAIADCVRLLGQDHPITLAARGNLAVAYRDAGDLGRAIPLHQQTLADCVRFLGQDHPTTLTARGNLATSYREAEDLGRAIPLHEQTLADFVRVLGQDHPGTLTARNNLALAYRQAEGLGRAIPVYEQALADHERVLGQDHPDTLAARGNLAAAYRDAGDMFRAFPLLQQVLADCERVLGQDHPTTLATRGNLAAAYQQSGDDGKWSVPLHEQTLADFVRVLGQDHRTTLVSRNNLAAAYLSAGDLDRAIPEYEQALADHERVLGQDHPDTKIVRGNLAQARQERAACGPGRWEQIAGDLG